MKRVLIFLIIYSCLSTALFAQPTISSFSPTSGPVGTSVTITGTNFSSNPSDNIVYFGAVRANVASATATSLVVTVPNNATYQPITVTVNNLIAYSNLFFAITYGSGASSLNVNSFAPKIDSTIGGFPNNITMADFDGDGKIDIVSVSAVSNSISVLRNTSSVAAVSFAKSIDSVIGNGGPNYSCIGDLDGDGKLDIVITNFNAGGTSTISILRNTSTSGNISFATKVDYATGNGSNVCKMSDFDGDGKLDIVIATGNSGIISIFRNTTTSIGNISFATAITYPSLDHPQSLFTGDFDNDGKPDIAFCNLTSYICTILKNTSPSTGNISFATPINFTSVSTHPSFITGGDLNGDGKIDLAISIPSENIIIILKNTSSINSISFAFDTPCYSGNNPSNISLGDLDGDGKPDLVAGSSNAGVTSIFKNTTSSISNISFANHVDYLTSSYQTSACIVDIDSDGKNDLAVANSISSFNYVSIFRNKVNEPIISSFTPLIGNSGTIVTIQGLNFNGTTNVSFAGIPALSFTVVSNNTITAIVPANASGMISVTNTFGQASIGGFNIVLPAPIITSISPQSAPAKSNATITGFNFSSTPANNLVYFGAVKANVTAATSNQLIVSVPEGSNYQPITVTRNNLTGYSSQCFNISFNGGSTAFNSTSFAPKIDSVVDAGPWRISAADFDGNGLADICLTNFNTGNVSIYRNTATLGVISLETPVKYSIGLYARSIAIGDLDGDGKLDFAVTNSNSDKVSIFRNTSTIGAISFAAKIDYATSGHPEGVSIADIDGDGKPDILVSNYSLNSFSVFRNTTTGSNISLDTKVDFVTGITPISIAVTDIDGDGKTDVCTANANSNTVSVFKNTSSYGIVSFNTKLDFATSSNPQSVSLADIDGDNKQDIAVVNTSSNSFSLLRNTSNVGAITFATKINIATSPSPKGIAVGDLNGDGKADIAITSSNSSAVSIFKNTSVDSVFTFAPAFDYLTGTGYFSSPNSISLSDLDGDGKLDIAVSNNGSNSISFFKNQITTPVPLLLINFIGTNFNKQILLNWKTINELNTSHFEIEHSTDGFNFNWIGNLKTVAGLNSNSYTFTHAQPKVGNNFYRLKMMDKDGKFTYSQIVKVKLDSNKEISISPNPAKDNIIIEYPFSKAGEITIIDAVGKVAKKILVANNSTQSTISIAGLSAGIYRVVWSDGIFTDSKTFIKQ